MSIVIGRSVTVPGTKGVCVNYEMNPNTRRSGTTVSTGELDSVSLGSDLDLGDDLFIRHRSTSRTVLAPNTTS